MFQDDLKLHEVNKVVYIITYRLDPNYVDETLIHLALVKAPVYMTNNEAFIVKQAVLKNASSDFRQPFYFSDKDKTWFNTLTEAKIYLKKQRYFMLSSHTASEYYFTKL